MRILYGGDSPTVNTGFGTVGKNIVDRLVKRGYEVVVLGVNHYGDPYDPVEFPYPIYPCEKGPPDAIFGTHKLWAIAKEFKPDLIFFLNDPWVIDRYLGAKNFDSPYLKSIAYFPLDAGPLKKEWAKILGGFDAQVCYSKFGEKIIIEASGGKRPENLYQIYHGVDTNVFKPVVQAQARSAIGVPQVRC